jgi:CRISPR system Cascade subunit CasC
MSRTILDIHVIQTVPPSNINRDDTGTTKTALYGGRLRARVSSQAWKRATRQAFTNLLDQSELGIRTKRIVELIAEEITRQNPALEERAAELATTVLTAAGIRTTSARRKDALPESGYLMFLSHRQIEGLADLAVTAAERAFDGKVEINKQDAQARAGQQHSVDISLFGRMVADAANLNVDAAAQVAHALSVHAVDNEYDYFTALDDLAGEADRGATMIGTVDFNSSTLYRYATVDVDRLQDNLGDPHATRRAVEAFTRAFISSMPAGKQNTFANRTLPDAVVIVVRETQSINLVGAFEEAIIAATNGGRVRAAIQRLGDYMHELHKAFDEQPVAAWSFEVGAQQTTRLADLTQPSTFTPTVAALGTLIASRLAGQP